MLLAIVIEESPEQCGCEWISWNKIAKESTLYFSSGMLSGGSHAYTPARKAEKRNHTYVIMNKKTEEKQPSIRPARTHWRNM